MIIALLGGGGGGTSHTHANQAILDQITAAYTTADKDKLDALSPNFKGVHTTIAGLQAAYPSASSGDFAIVQETNTFFYWNVLSGLWTNTGSSQISISVVDNLDSTSSTAALSANMGRNLLTIIRNHWRTTTGFLATPNSTSQIGTNQDLRTLFGVGDGLRYRISGIEYYGIVKNITATAIDIAGASLSGNIEALAYTSEVLEYNITLGNSTGAFGAATVSNILKTKEKLYYSVPNDVYFVEAIVSADVSDSGTKSYINVQNGANLVLTANTNKGVIVDGTAFSQTNNSSGIALNTAQTFFAANTPIELYSVNAGNKNSDNVMVKINFVRK